MTTEMKLTQEEKTYGMLAHLAALAGFVIPFGNIIGPLVIWLLKKDELAWVDRHGKESLNFQISITLYAFVSGILVFILIGILLLIAVGVFSLVMIIIASVRVSNGEDFKYPLCIPFIK